MITGTDSSSSPVSTPLPSTTFPLQQQQSKSRRTDARPSPQEESMHHHPPRRSNSLHRKASNISTSHKTSSNDHSSNPKPSASDSQQQQRSTRSQQTQRRSSESRKQPVKIQNYVIYRKTIGQGSMGKVKLAECLTDRDHQKYAVKIMPKVDLTSIAATGDKPKDPKDTPQEREQRTVRELAIMYLLRHPNICKLVDWISEGDYYYMFLEYVDGGQLLDYIMRHGMVREKQARNFARQIASALDYCHRNSIVHRDLKIENILITRDEKIKIIDFGLSNIYSPSKLLSTFCGSLYFAAPELLKARHYTGPEVDVWSFGVVLYVLVCGRVPFDDTSLPALHAKIKSGIVDEYPDHLSKDCIDLLSKILVVDPRKRLTLAAIENHPWMKKGYEEPIYSNIPPRQMLEKVDMDVVRGMHGFGLGDEQLIRSKLDTLIKTPDYKQAIIKIEQNQHLEWQRQHEVPLPRWRRGITSTGGKRSNFADDDPLSLPAMYDPLLSIYYLAKERKEYNTRRQLDSVESKPLYHSAGGLSRSTSTVAPRSKTVVTKVKGNASSSTLVQRKAEVSTMTSTLVDSDTSKTPVSTSPPQRKISISSRLGRSSSVRLITKSVAERTNSIREKSKGAVKILGSMLHNRPLMFTDVKPKRTSTIITTTSDVGPEPLPDQQQSSPTTSSFSHSSPKKQWLKSDPHGHNCNIEECKNSSSFSSSSSSTTATNGSKRRSWRRLSMIRQGNDATTRSCMDQSIIADSTHEGPSPQPKRFSEGDKDREPSAPPTTKFHFGRGMLFRTDSPQQLMTDLRHALVGMDITIQSETTPYKYICYCDHPTPSFLKPRHRQHDNEQQRSVFSVMIYQARWTQKRYGIKVVCGSSLSRKAIQHALELKLDGHTRKLVSSSSSSS